MGIFDIFLVLGYNIGMIFFFYAILAATVVWLSIKLADYVDMLDKSTNISGAFIGGVLLAAVTSLPELFTSISATVLVGENELVLGNILGSNLFNFAVLGFSFLLFIRSAIYAKINRSHLITVAVTIVMYAFIALDMFLEKFPQIGWVSLSTPFIAISYAVFLYFTPKTQESDEDAVAITLSLKQIVTRFTICSVLLVGASVALTYASDAIADESGIGKTFAGAILLGIATSLPETVSSVSLCRKRNYDAAVGNILGSGVFNCAILVIADLLSFSPNMTEIYVRNSASVCLLVFGAIIAVLVAGMLLALDTKGERKKLKTAVVAAVGTCAVAAYIIFTVLSVAA